MREVKRRRERGGYVTFVVALTAALMMGSLGFAIDAAVLYSIRARLSAACDGAALAAARNLNVGLTMAEQEASARARAVSFYEANFPQQFLGAQREAPVVDIPVSAPGSVLTVTTSGSARAGTFFMRYFGTREVRLRASGTASRRNVNLMIVLDRSVSMNSSGSCVPMVNAARDFVGKFVEDRDQVGMIAFGTDMSKTAPSTRFKGPLISEINKIKCGNSTSMTMAYWRAYQELVNLRQPSALNVIVLFTDGNPNGLYAKFSTQGGSKCNGGSLEGIFVRTTSNAPMNGNLAGMYRDMAANVSSLGAVRINKPGCKYTDNNRDADFVLDIDGIPQEDVFGNRTTGYPNQYVHPEAYLNPNGKIQHTSPYVHFLANKNTLDHAAMRVRNRALDTTIGVVTFVIGLGSYSDPINEQPDDVLLRRVANDPRGRNDPNPVYVDDPDLPDGMYIRATEAGQMADAFQRIASEVLRLSR